MTYPNLKTRLLVYAVVPPLTLLGVLLGMIELARWKVIQLLDIAT